MHRRPSWTPSRTHERRLMLHIKLLVVNSIVRALHVIHQYGYGSCHALGWSRALHSVSVAGSVTHVQNRFVAVWERFVGVARTSHDQSRHQGWSYVP